MGRGHRRRISKFHKKKSTKFGKIKGIVVNWINGHPVNEAQSLRTDASIKTKSSKSKKKRFKLKRKQRKLDQKAKEEASRKIYVNIADSSREYADFVPNKIRTAKYNIVTFLPKNLFEQFRRIANFYFLVLVLLQLVPELTQIGAGLAAVPVIIIVSASAIKDAFEDWKRHNSDNDVNFSKCHSLRNWVNVNYKQGGRISIVEKIKRFFSKYHRERVKLQKKFSASVEFEQHDRNEPMWQPTYWIDVKVGDLVRLRNNDPIPADMIILSTSESDCLCYVETKNLDGETNLKIRKGPEETQHIKTTADCASTKFVLETENPNVNLYSFNGKLLIDQKGTTEAKVVPININGLLLRGCYIRNTEWVIGVVVYTGNDTRLMMNLGVTPSKRSRIERLMNPQIIINFFMLFIICVTCAIVQSQFLNTNASAPYLYATFSVGKQSSSSYVGFIAFWSSLLLFQTLVPIALYITVEICKTVQAYFIYSDIEMYHEETGNRCIPRAWNLSDDLGQIEYVFSDKTGTLTRNVMEFRKCSIAGRVYGYSEPQFAEEGSQFLVTKEKEMEELRKQVFELRYMVEKYSLVDPKLYKDMIEDGQKKLEIIQFFTLVAVCHTVLAENSEVSLRNEPELNKTINFEKELEKIVYKAQSPDEAALVTTAKDMGFAFIKRIQDDIYVDVLGTMKKFKLLNVLEFNSTRKRMSVIVKDEESDKIILFCKGADTVIYERLANCNSKIAQITLDQLEEFAEEGLRTLCLSFKIISNEDYERWSLKYLEASSAIFNRDLMMDAVADEIEQSLELLGATAIEDRLQEGVPECIELLGRAGLKLWVLTGDKMETAINIGFSCNLLRKDMLLLVIKGKDAESTKKQLAEALDRIWSVDYTFGAVFIPNKSNVTYALIIDGTSLKYALEGESRQMLLNLGTKCKSVVCCRVSPLQKAQVVDLVKRGKNVMTLAIGDGANDVSMIQAADVGVGIAGVEGLQASMSSDYSIAQFRYLSRLLLVHGKWAYLRTAQVTLQSFYKNIVFVIPLFWYQIYCGFTSQFMYDYMYMILYNLFFTMLPVLMIGFFDQDLNHVFSMKVPQIYAYGINQEYYSIKLFLLYALEAIYQSLVSFFLPLAAYDGISLDHRGFTEDRLLIGTVMCLSIVISANFFAGLYTFSWFYMNFAAIFASDLLFVLIFIIWSFLPDSTLAGYPLMVFSSARFYVVILLTASVALFPRFVFKYCKATFYPNNLDICREIQKYNLDQQALFASALIEKGNSSRMQPSSLADTCSIAAPPKVATTELRSNAYELTPTTIPQIHEESSYRRKHSILDMKTGRFVMLRGFAFSQEEGMRNVIESKNFSNLNVEIPQPPRPALDGNTRASFRRLHQ